MMRRIGDSRHPSTRKTERYDDWVALGAAGQELTGPPDDLVEGTSLVDRQVELDQESADQISQDQISQLHQAISSFFQLGEGEIGQVQALLNQILEQGQKPSFQNVESLALALARLGGDIQTLELSKEACTRLTKLMVDLAESGGATAARCALCFLNAMVGDADFVLKAFGDLCALCEGATDPSIVSVLEECIGHLPQNFPNYGALIDQVQRLFNRVLDSNPAIAPAVFGVLCAIVGDADFVLNVFGDLCEEAADPAIAAVLGECAGYLPPEFPNYGDLINQVRGLFDEALRPDSDPAIAPAAFGALCALCARTHDHDFGAAAILGAFSALCALCEEAADPAIAAVLAECAEHLPSNSRGEYNDLYGALIGQVGELFEQIRGREEAALAVLNIWGQLLTRMICETRPEILGKIAEFAHGRGIHFFSCREDVLWRALHTSDNPKVLQALAKTHLRLALGQAVGVVVDCTKLATQFGREACDSCLSVLAKDLGRVIIVIAEIQQRLILLRGKDSIERRLEHYADLAARRRARFLSMQPFVAAIAYLGYMPEGFRQEWEGREGEGEGRAFATMGIGQRDDYGVPERKSLMAEAKDDLPSYERLASARIGAIRQQFSDLNLDGEVQDVLIVIMASHLLTPRLVEGFSDGAKAMCEILSVDEMNPKINSKQVHDLVGDFLAEGEGGGEMAPAREEFQKFTRASLSFTEGVVGRLAAERQRAARYKARAKKLGGEVSPTGSPPGSPLDSPGSPGTPRVELRRQRDAAEAQNTVLEEKNRLQGQLWGLVNKFPGLGRQIFDLGMRITGATSLEELNAIKAQLDALQAQQPQVQAGDVPLPDDENSFLA